MKYRITITFNVETDPDFSSRTDIKKTKQSIKEGLDEILYEEEMDTLVITSGEFE